MQKLLVSGGHSLSGSVRISGAKNAVLPIIAATLLSDDSVVLKNIPHLNDVTTMINLLGCLGASISVDETMAVDLNTSAVNCYCAPYDLVKMMRASILVLGPLLARYGQAQVSLPGGCSIGSRPVDVHLKGMEALGAKIEVINGFVHASVQGRLIGAEVDLGKITVTGTENILMAAVLAKGKTTIYNAAREPEVGDLARFLNVLGAKISGIDTNTLVIEGVDSLGGGCYSVMPDRIEAGTFLVAGAATRGKITVNNILPDTMRATLDKLEEAGAHLTIKEDAVTLDMKGNRPKAVDISTAPYPLMPTDMQAQFMAMNILAEGKSVVAENVFENRFMHVHEMKRMGANIELSTNYAYCYGVSQLTAAPVMATDLRASASLVIAALMADGDTVIDRIYHIDRGYECIEEKLRMLGAKIKRISSS